VSRSCDPAPSTVTVPVPPRPRDKEARAEGLAVADFAAPAAEMFTTGGNDQSPV
jgi:hypothetical protein